MGVEIAVVVPPDVAPMLASTQGTPSFLGRLVEEAVRRDRVAAGAVRISSIARRLDGGTFRFCREILARQMSGNTCRGVQSLPGYRRDVAGRVSDKNSCARSRLTRRWVRYKASRNQSSTTTTGRPGNNRNPPQKKKRSAINARPQWNRAPFLWAPNAESIVWPKKDAIERGTFFTEFRRGVAGIAAGLIDAIMAIGKIRVLISRLQGHHDFEWTTERGLSQFT